MDHSIVNSVVTRAFCLMTPTIRSRLHFFPTAGSTTGHYPVSCEIALFGKGLEKRSVQIEGGRLNQPDGIRIEDAFPALEHEASGLCGLEVIFECPQGRINLSRSQLVIEIISPQFSLTYGAAPLLARTSDHPGAAQRAETAGVKAPEFIGVAIQDNSVVPSLVVVNSSEELLRPEFRHMLRDGEAPLQLGTVAASSVVEFPLDEALCKNAPIHEALWGSAVVEKVWSGSSWSRGSATCYILHRDPVSKRPVSVCAL